MRFGASLSVLVFAACVGGCRTPAEGEGQRLEEEAAARLADLEKEIEKEIETTRAEKSGILPSSAVCRSRCRP
jgi:hypothetical protein